jgi:hypothetical protein
VSALSTTQVDRRKYAAIAAEERPGPDLQLVRPEEGQYNHVTLRVSPINARFGHVASFQESPGVNQKNDYFATENLTCCRFLFAPVEKASHQEPRPEQ